MVYCILEDHLGYIWIATINGLDVYNPANGRMTRFRKNESENSLCDNFVISLCEDKNGDMWIGTGSYVNKFIRKDSSFIYYDKDDGLGNNNIFEILRDNQNNLWFATGGGLSRFDTVTGKFRTYGTEDGLQSPEFNLRACFNSPDGEVFFGGMNGLNSFYPGRLEDNPYVPEMVITSCYKPTKEGREMLWPGPDMTIELDYSDRAFTVEFVGLEFTNPEKNQYAYMLEGVSPEWINIGNRRFIPFTNLASGEYTLKIKGSNNDGHWNENGTTLRIIIHPPFWRTTWAWVLYILMSILALMLFIRWRERRLKAERDLLETKIHERTLQIEQKNAEIVAKNETLNLLNEELTALNKTKDKFFSIIAHDLRNPFNSIIGLADIVLGHLTDPEHARTRKSVSDIREASRHAFDLLQNLLIWARSQTGNLEFNPTTFDLTERIDDNMVLVQGQAARKNIVLVNHSDAPVPVTGDSHMINTILRNLLTNAIKFTPHEGRVEVSVSCDEDAVLIHVRDSGVGISPEIMEKLFRLDNKYTHKGTDQERGSGLGLILCKEFAEKHNGAITVESTVGSGSCFTVRLAAVSPGTQG
jgi:signal transduction histidine kinase